jgi:hypothetical protein
MFFRGSRYETVRESTFRAADGREIRYKRLRFVPRLKAAAALRVNQGDRPDLLAFRALDDAELFWRLADVNRVRRPVELTATPGRLVGVPGVGGGEGNR